MPRAVTAGSVGRRPFLKLGLVGGAVLGVGGAGLLLRDALSPSAPGPGLQVLTADEYEVLCAIADRICPALGEGAPGALALAVPKQLDAVLASMPRRVQGDVKAALAMVQSAALGILLGERTRSFTRLSGEEQDEALGALRDSRLALRRSVFVGLRSMISSYYFADAQTWQRMGYPGPPSPQALRMAFAGDLVDLDVFRTRANG